MKYFVLGWCALLLGGCQEILMQNARELSTGFTGCAPAENEISDYEIGTSALMWVATCQGKRYRCTSYKEHASCAPAVESSAPKTSGAP